MNDGHLRHDILLGLWTLQRGLCAYCGCGMAHPDHPSRSKPDSWPTIDHMLPVVRGGADTIENRVACCNACNQAKGSLDAAEFLRVRLNPLMLREAQRQDQCRRREEHKAQKDHHAGR